MKTSNRSYISLAKLAAPQFFLFCTNHPGFILVFWEQNSTCSSSQWFTSNHPCFTNLCVIILVSSQSFWAEGVKFPNSLSRKPREAIILVTRMMASNHPGPDVHVCIIYINSRQGCGRQGGKGAAGAEQAREHLKNKAKLLEKNEYESVCGRRKDR